MRSISEWEHRLKYLNFLVEENPKRSADSHAFPELLLYDAPWEEAGLRQAGLQVSQIAEGAEKRQREIKTH